jgi:DNA-binding PadR family transcriptional regulator
MNDTDMSTLECYDGGVSLRHAALGLLAKEPASGYDLLKKFKSSMHPVWPATQSQLYGELNKLAAAGLTTVSDAGPRGRKEYAITDAGRAELHRWMRSPDEDPPHRSAVLLRVFLLGELTPSQARQYIESLRDWVEQELKSYEETRDANDWSDDDSGFFARAALENLLRAARRDFEWTKWVLDELDRREGASH